jgi:hypothetical protein
MIRTMRLLRKYCLGDSAVNIQVVRAGGATPDEWH